MLTGQRAPSILLISCYELGHQPLALATPLAFLRRKGYAARGLDISVSPLDERALTDADFIGVSVPMHTALRLGLQVAKRVRSLNPGAYLCFYGLYATLNAELLRRSGANAVLSGESEEALVELISRVTAPSGASGRPDFEIRSELRRLTFPLPHRRDLPALERYAHIEQPDGSCLPVGAVETSRGCLHACRHCPIPPVYHGRFFVVPRERVLEDIHQLVASGARHINFADPDFLNGPGHGLPILRALSTELPGVTFDFTAKVEHLLRHRDRLDEIVSLGCAFVVTAVESLNDDVLALLSKGHTHADVVELLRAARQAGLTLRPTFIPFTPWSSLKDYTRLLRFVADEDLVSNVDPVQWTIRLLIPPGSHLLGEVSRGRFELQLDPEQASYRWKHPDPRMDSLARGVQDIVERGLERGRDNPTLFQSVAERAFAAQRPHERGSEIRLQERPSSKPAPRLTEAWFC